MIKYSSWPTVPLHNLAEKIDYGHTASALDAGNGPKFLRITDIQDGQVDWSTVPLCDCNIASKERYALASGDIVFARTGATTGKSFLIRDCPDDSVFASYLIRVRANGLVDPNYLIRFFQTPSYWHQITRSSTGTAQPGVNASRLKELSIPLPPLDEQRRIAAILDKADAVRRKRQQAIALTEDLLRSAFLEMFGDPVTNPRGWDVAPLGKIAQIQGGLQVTTKRKDNPVEAPYLRVANVYRDRLFLDEIKTIRVQDSELKRTKLIVGDLLIVEGHGNKEEIGRSSVWDGSIPNCTHQNHLIRVRVDASKVDPIYVSAYLNSAGGRRQLKKFGKTTSGLNTISSSNVKATNVLIPPLIEQKKYLTMKQHISKIIACEKQHHQHSEDLFSSLLQRAFQGDL